MHHYWVILKALKGQLAVYSWLLLFFNSGTFNIATNTINVIILLIRIYILNSGKEMLKKFLMYTKCLIFFAAQKFWQMWVRLIHSNVNTQLHVTCENYWQKEVDNKSTWCVKLEHDIFSHAFIPQNPKKPYLFSSSYL